MASYFQLHPYASDAPLRRIRIGEALVHSYYFNEAVDAITHYAASGAAPGYIVTPNAQHIVLLERDKYLRQIYSAATFVLSDGASLQLAARVFGEKIPQRITGVDMFEALCARAACDGLRVFLLGGRPGSANRAAAVLQHRHPNLIVAGTHCPPVGFEEDPREQREVEACIVAAKPHLLFVALGAPKQEYWMYENRRQLGVPVSIGVGGSFEMVGGLVKRAPRWVQNIACEWLYRLLLEPKRLWKRYLIGNLRFASIVLRQRFHPSGLLHDQVQDAYRESAGSDVSRTAAGIFP